ncbi:MAG: hypothetical protein ACKVH0_21365, partial [Alphaproteobacteria bacterium]
MHQQPAWTPPARTVANAAHRSTVEPATRRQAIPQPEYYPGNQTMPGTPSGRRTAPRIKRGGGVTLNFVDTDIREVVDIVLSETLGLNYVIDQRVTGAITARTNSPIARQNVLAALENILAL